MFVKSVCCCVAVLLFSTALLVVGDQTNWVPWEPLPQPRARGQAVRLFAHLFLVGGEKQEAMDKVVPALDFLVINMNYYFKWNPVRGAVLPAPIKGRSFALAVDRIGPLWNEEVFPIYVCYACAESNTTSSTMVELWVNIAMPKAAKSSQHTYRNQIPRRMASFGQFTRVTNSGPMLADYTQSTYLFIFGGLDNQDQFVHVPETHEVYKAPNTTKRDGKTAWALLRSPNQRMPLPWCLCSVVSTPGGLQLSGCVDCGTMEPVAGTLVFNPFPSNPNDPQWTVCTPDYPQCTTITPKTDKHNQLVLPPPTGTSLSLVGAAASDDKYEPFFPATMNTAQGGLINQFVAVFSQAPYTEHLSAQIVFYDLVLMQQNVISTVSSQANRTDSFVTIAGAWLYSIGGELLNPAVKRSNGSLTALSGNVQLFPAVMADVSKSNMEYYVGEVIEAYVGDGCRIETSRLRLATGPDCQTQIPGTDVTTCGNPSMFPTDKIVLPPKKVLSAYICHTWGTCAVRKEDRQPCSLSANATHDDCRWAHCCWDNEAKQCYSYATEGISTPASSIFWTPLMISLSNYKSLPLLISNRPPPPVVHHWYEQTAYIAGMAAGVVIIGYFVIAYAFRRRKSTGFDGRGNPSNVFVAFGKRYSILRQIGQGSFGTVFLAERAPDSRQVALKCIPYSTSKQRDAALAEYDMIHKLTHPNLIQVFDLILNWDAATDSKQRMKSKRRNSSRRSLDSKNNLNATPEEKKRLSNLNNPMHPMKEPLLNESETERLREAEDITIDRGSRESDRATRLSSNLARSSSPYGATSSDQSSLAVRGSGDVLSSTEDLALGAYDEFSNLTSFVCLVQEFFPQGDLCNFIVNFQQTRALPKVGYHPNSAAPSQRDVQSQSRFGTSPGGGDGSQPQFALKSDTNGFVFIPEQYILSVTRQLCTLLQYLHSKQPPIIHRDLKPENILIDGDRIVVTDFGLAHMQQADYATTRAGTLFFSAPESFKKKYTASVDMWAVGCVMYAMATQRALPENARIMFSDVDDDDFEESIREDLSPYSDAFADLVLGLLAKNPMKRADATTILKKLSRME